MFAKSDYLRKKREAHEIFSIQRVFTKNIAVGGRCRREASNLANTGLPGGFNDYNSLASEAFQGETYERDIEGFMGVGVGIILPYGFIASSELTGHYNFDAYTSYNGPSSEVYNQKRYILEFSDFTLRNSYSLGYMLSPRLEVNLGANFSFTPNIKFIDDKFYLNNVQTGLAPSF